MRVRLIAAVFALIAGIAQAADSPRYVPRRDAAITYATKGTDPALPPSITIRYFSAADRLRIEGGPIGFLLVDRVMERVEFVVSHAKLVMELPPGGGITDGFILGPQLHFARAGQSRALGRDCTLYDVTADQASGRVCLTADGLLLRGEGRGRDGRSASIEATAVSFATQPAGLFSPPEGAKFIDWPK